MIIADEWRVKCKGERTLLLTELSMIMRALLEEEVVDRDLLEWMVKLSSKDREGLDKTQETLSSIINTLNL